MKDCISRKRYFWIVFNYYWCTNSDSINCLSSCVEIVINQFQYDMKMDFDFLFVPSFILKSDVVHKHFPCWRCITLHKRWTVRFSTLNMTCISITFNATHNAKANATKQWRGLQRLNCFEYWSDSHWICNTFCLSWLFDTYFMTVFFSYWKIFQIIDTFSSLSRSLFYLFSSVLVMFGVHKFDTPNAMNNSL